MIDEEIDAMEAGWQMDRAISLAIFGLEPQECLVGGHPPGCPGSIPITPYSTDIAAAWLVVEKMRKYSGTRFAEAFDRQGPWHWSLLSTKYFCLYVCRAALKCCKSVAGKDEGAKKAPLVFESTPK